MTIIGAGNDDFGIWLMITLVFWQTSVLLPTQSNVCSHIQLEIENLLLILKLARNGVHTYLHKV